MSTPLLYAGLSGMSDVELCATSTFDDPKPANSLLGRSAAGVRSSVNFCLLDCCLYPQSESYRDNVTGQSILAHWQ